MREDVLLFLACAVQNSPNRAAIWFHRPLRSHTSAPHLSNIQVLLLHYVYLMFTSQLYYLGAETVSQSS